MIIELQSDSAMARVETVGAELISLTDAFGTEYMWQKDAAFWGKCSPLLFPNVGNLNDGKALFDGVEYSIPKHGFAAQMDFKVMYKSKDKVILNRSYDDETLAVYPYKFSLTITYSIDGGNILINYNVLNIDDKPINYCLGAHPGFNVPIGEGCFEDYCLEFNSDEGLCTTYDLDRLCFDPDKQIDLTHGKNIIELKYDLFDSDAFVFDNINSNSVKLKSVKTGRGVQFDFNGFKSIAFWTPIKKNAPFLCLEPWNGMAYRSGEDEDFAHKFGVCHLEVDAQDCYNITIIPM